MNAHTARLLVTCALSGAGHITHADRADLFDAISEVLNLSGESDAALAAHRTAEAIRDAEALQLEFKRLTQ